MAVDIVVNGCVVDERVNGGDRLDNTADSVDNVGTATVQNHSLRFYMSTNNGLTTSCEAPKVTSEVKQHQIRPD